MRRGEGNNSDKIYRLSLDNWRKTLVVNWRKCCKDVFAKLTDPPCEFLLTDGGMSVRSLDSAKRRVPKRIMIKTWNSRKFVAASSVDDGIIYGLAPSCLIFSHEGKEILTWKAVCGEAKYKPFAGGGLGSKLVAAAGERLFLTDFDAELMNLKTAIASVPWMKLLWCLKGSKKLIPAGMVLNVDKQLSLQGGETNPVGGA